MTYKPVVFLFFLLLTVSGALGAQRSPSSASVRVFASVLPIETFVKRVGGERVDTNVMVRAGQSPATYDPSPQQVVALAGADLYVRVGVPFEASWMKRIRAANPEMTVLDLRNGLVLRAQEDHGHEVQGDAGAPGDSADGEALDPHVWTSPRLARQMAVAIRDALSRLDPAGAQEYAARQAGFDNELTALDAELSDTLAGLGNRSFLVYHPAWGYFADAYDLTQIPIEREGKAPGPRRLSALIEQARAAGARVIFVQPQFDRRAAAQVAASIDGRVETADPLAADYAGSLRRFAGIIAEANGNGAKAGGQTNAGAKAD